ncbi:helicase-related protein [Salinibaculum salinum]|uniref:helicase-related protein n=1 Tax=Salinibaculum salinum TaxID=3131996 RepID=UPI0030EC9460
MSSDSELLENLMPGQVIRNRNRLWRVDKIDDAVVTATPLDGNNSEKHRFYYPIEQIERGDLPLPDIDRLGNPQFQDLLIQANRLSMLHGTAPLMSLQRSRVIPTEYQLTPVVMGLDMPQVRLLLADDVGLGKTIEAGLITSELLARNRAEDILIVTPANLRDQWRQALKYFFHIDAPIIDRRKRRAMEKEIPPGTSPWDYYSKLIVSIDYAKQPSIRHEILEQDWDMVIMDEAHQAAKPHQQSKHQSVSKQRWEFAQDITDNADHALLLTATPHNGYKDCYASLLRMVNEQMVSGSQANPNINREIATQHVVQRRRSDVEEWFQEDDTESPFPDRDQDIVTVSPTGPESAMYDSVRSYGDALLDAAKESDNRTLARWTMVHFLKRALSSPAALRESLANREEKLTAQLEELDEAAAQIDDSAGVTEEMAQANALDNDPGEEYDEAELGERVERIVAGDRAAIEMELEALEETKAAAEKVTLSEDGKLQRLLEETLPARSQYPRVIIFTKYVDTLEYLEAEIENAKTNVTSDLSEDLEVFTLYGDLNEAQRQERFQEFAETNPAVLIATDVISEGMNLQHASNQIIHYELPWNPNRLEQRNGRIDRYGQAENEVVIRTMVVEDKMDRAVLETLIQKAQDIREEYGFSPPYLDDDEGVLQLIENEGLDVGIPQTSLDEFSSDSQPSTTHSAFDDETLQRIQSESFYGHTDVDLSDVRRRREKAHELIGGPDAVEEFVKSGLDMFECELDWNADATLSIEVNDPQLRGPDIQAEYTRVSFDPERATQDADVEMLDIAHPLVQQLIEAVKEVGLTDEDRYGRTAMRGADEVEDPMAIYTALVRYFAHTGDQPSVMEELIQVGLPIYGDEPLSHERVEELIQAESRPANRTRDEATFDLESAIEHEQLEDTVREYAYQRRDEIAEERREMRERLEESGYGESLEGIDTISFASDDLLTVSLYYPSEQ